MSKTVLQVVLLFCLIFSGCKKTPPPPPKDGAKTGKSNSATANTEKSNSAQATKRPAPVKRATIEGNWILQSMFNTNPGNPRSPRPGYWYPIAAVNISKKNDGGYLARILAKPGIIRIDDVQVKKATPKSVSLALKVGGQTQAEVNMELQETMSVGNSYFYFDRFPFLPARMIAVEQNDLKGFEEPELPKEFEEFDKAVNAIDKEKSTEKIKKFIADYPQSPLVYLARQAFIQIAILTKTPSAIEDLRTQLPICHNHLKYWGSALHQDYQVGDTRRIFISTRRDLKLSRQTAIFDVIRQLSLDAIANAKKLKSPQAIIDGLTEIKQQSEIEIDYATVTSEKPKDLPKAIARLKDMQKKYRFHPLISHALAIHAEKNKDLSAAISHYASLLTLPRFEQYIVQLTTAKNEKLKPIRETLEELWKQKHGNLDQLDDYLKQVYSQNIDHLISPKPTPRKSVPNQHVVLCELFTSSTALDCIGPDFALSSIERTYSPDDLVVLRYHLSFPNPNPLMSRVSDPRAFDYHNARPPIFIVDGTPRGIISGDLGAATMNYKQMRSLIDKQLAEKPPAVTVSVDATLKDDSISITANASTVKTTAKKTDGEKTDEQPSPKDLRLRIVLAESRIPYQAANGLTTHDMVVRDMPGGVEGIKEENGKFQFTKTISLTDLKEKHLEFLRSFEERRNTKFDKKPIPLKNLTVVAFVQDIRSGKILQTKAVQVQGTWDVSSSNQSKSPSKKAKGLPKRNTTSGKSGPVIAPKPKG